MQKQVAFFRQSWINRTGLSEKDDREALKMYAAYTAKGAREAAEKESCAKLVQAGPEDSAERQQRQAIRDAVCDGDPLGRSSLKANKNLKDMWWMERPDKPMSEIARASYVLGGLPLYQPKRDDYAMLRSSADALYPMVSILASRMDKKALDAEIAALGLTGLAKVRAKILFGGATAAAKTWGDIVREDAKSDPKIAKALAAAETAYTDWGKFYQEHKAELDLAYAVEDKVMAVAPGERAQPHTIGCEELRKTLKSYIESKKPKNKDEIKEVATDSLGHPLLTRLVLCDAAEGRWADAAAERAVLSTGRIAAGPYTAAYWAILDAGGGYPTDTLRSNVVGVTNRVLDEHVGRVTTLNEVYDGTGGVSREQYKAKGGLIEQGRVATVKKGKSGIEITFKKEKWTEPDWKCTKTNRINQFQSDGTPIYFEKCAIVGSHVEEYQLDPLVFTDRSASDVKVGQILKVVSSSMKIGSSTRWESFVLEIDAPAVGKKPPALLSYFGLKPAK